MAGGLEEPILSTLGKESQAPELFMNAFHKAAQINIQKQNLEKELATLQSNMFFKQQEHDLDMQKFGWQQKYQTAELNRQYAADAATAAFRNRTANRLEKGLLDKMGESDKNMDAVSEYGDAVHALIGEYPETYNSQEFANKKALLDTKYTTVLGTKEGKRAAGQLEQSLDNARMAAHQHADEIKSALDATIAGQEQGGRGLGRSDLTRSDDAFRTIGDKTVITEYPIMVGSQVAQWGTVPPNDPRLKLPQDEQDQLGFRTRSSPTKTWEGTKDLWNQMRKYGGQDMSQRPAPVNMSKATGHNVGDTVRLKNGQTVTIDTINTDGTFSYH